MNMKDFHAWVKAGNFDKPRQADDSYTSRLQEHNKDVLRTIEKISGQRTSPERSQLQEEMSAGQDGGGIFTPRTPPASDTPQRGGHPPGYYEFKPTPRDPKPNPFRKPFYDDGDPSTDPLPDGIYDVPYFYLPGGVRIKNPLYRG